MRAHIGHLLHFTPPAPGGSTLAKVRTRRIHCECGGRALTSRLARGTWKNCGRYTPPGFQVGKREAEAGQKLLFFFWEWEQAGKDIRGAFWERTKGAAPLGAALKFSAVLRGGGRPLFCSSG